MKYVVIGLVWFAFSALVTWRFGKFLAATRDSQDSYFIDEARPFGIRSSSDDDL